MKLLCLHFPSLRHKKNPKPSTSGSRVAKPVSAIEKICYVERLVLIKFEFPAPDAAPYFHVNSQRMQPLTAAEYLRSLETDLEDRNIYFARKRKDPEAPIIIGTTDEKKMLLADDMIRELRESQHRLVPPAEFRAAVLRDDPKCVYLAVDRSGEFSLVELGEEDWTDQ